MKVVHFGWGFVVLGLALTLLACSSSGAGSTGGGNGGGGAGGSAATSYGKSDCGKCVQQQCAPELATCSADPACATHAKCVLACPTGDDGNVDSTCASACPKGTSSESIAAAAALDQCRTVGSGATNCASCNAKPVTLPKDSPLNQTCPTPPIENACYTCQDQHCCDSLAACKANPDCGPYDACVKACLPSMGGAACQLSCAQTYPNGVGDYAGNIACAGFWCTTECSGTTPPSACYTCYATKDGPCGVAWAAAQSTADGLLLGDCVEPCTDTACDDACFNQYPDAVEAYYQWYECTSLACPTCTG